MFSGILKGNLDPVKSHEGHAGEWKQNQFVGTF